MKNTIGTIFTIAIAAFATYFAVNNMMNNLQFVLAMGKYTTLIALNYSVSLEAAAQAVIVIVCALTFCTFYGAMSVVDDVLETIGSLFTAIFGLFTKKTNKEEA